MRRQPVLLLATAAMLPLTLLCALGLWLDPRVLAGAPLWLKPFKFSLSVMIYTATMGLMLGALPETRLVRWIGHLVGGMLLLEMVCIVGQAARGTHSHFQMQMPDRIVFGLMGIAIMIVFFLTALASLLWLKHSQQRTMRLAVALGLAVSTFGGALGGLMLLPSAEQKEVLARGEMPALMGHHTVGAPDGGPGMPLTNWSITHGDLRVAHFLGLHGMQAIPLLAFLLLRRAKRPLQGVWLLTASYLGLTLLILWQAFRAQPLLHPDALTLAALAVWAALSAMGLAWARGNSVEVPV